MSSPAPEPWPEPSSAAEETCGRPTRISKDLFFEKLAKGEFEFKKKTPRDTGAQAEYHTDVYLGLGHREPDGTRILFVADCRAGAGIAESLSEDERRGVERAMDRAAADAYRSAGFEPVFIDGLVTNALSLAQAGLDCLTSEIRFPVRWAEPASK